MTDSEAVESLYLPIVKAIALRIRVADEALNRFESDPENPLRLGDCEQAILQIRLICELLILGSAAAHRNEGGKQVSDNRWRPKDTFYELAKLSDHPLQLPVEIQLNKNGEGQHHINPSAQPIPFDVLHRIYGQCGDILHIPTIKQVVSNRIPQIDLARIRQWIEGFRTITMAHALMLPERETILLCVWEGSDKSEPEAFRLDALGSSSLDIASYPPFDLLP